MKHKTLLNPLLVLSLIVTSVIAFTNSPTVAADGDPFTDSGISLPGVGYSSAAWGDYDNDGDLDILLTGNQSPISKIYRNDGGGVFTDINAALTGIWWSAAAWGDYDNDGDLDVLLTGATCCSGNFDAVYRNDGNDVFTNINLALANAGGGSVAWGDYDNDGDLDILLTGRSDSSPWRYTRIYRNDGGDAFADIDAPLTAVDESAAAWGDYDNDGDLDILLTGESNMYPITKIYRNDGASTESGWNFTDIGAALAGIRVSSVAWGDYDNDGDLDILLTGCTDFWCANSLAKVYRNDGGDVFTDINAALTGVWWGTTAWGDYDNDGDLDILLTGTTLSNPYTPFTEIYQNEGNDVFTPINAALPGVFVSSVAWGDYDNDGALDILLTGETDSGAITKIYRNNTTTGNTPPSAPTGLLASVNDATVTLSWNAAGDVQTPADGLTYNLRVGATSGGLQVVSPMAGDNGYRHLAALGNANHGLTAFLNNLPDGVYYWSVQALDTAWAGSAFASEGIFTVGALPGATLTATPATPEVYPGDPISVDLNIQGASDLYAAQAACSVNPAVLQPQSATFGSFFDPVDRLVGANVVSPTLGTWLGAISQANPAGPLSGDGLFATVTYTATNPGATAITCDPLLSDRDGFTQTVSFSGASVTVLPFATLDGVVRYQGRTDHSGITITATGSVTRTATTDGSGAFALDLKAGTYQVVAQAAGYLPVRTTITVASGESLTLPGTVLKGGSLDDDGVIDIGDVTLLTANFGLTVPPGDPHADINGDGVVNVQDLAIIGGNYELSGEQPW